MKENQKDQKMKPLVVHLRLFKRKNGQKGLSYNEDRTVQNENNLMKLTYRLLEWDNFIKRIKSLGMVEIKVEEIFEQGSNGLIVKKGKEVERIKEEVRLALHGSTEIKLTPEQKEIKELKEQMAEILSTTGNPSKAPTAEKQPKKKPEKITKA